MTKDEGTGKGTGSTPQQTLDGGPTRGELFRRDKRRIEERIDKTRRVPLSRRERKILKLALNEILQLNIELDRIDKTQKEILWNLERIYVRLQVIRDEQRKITEPEKAKSSSSDPGTSRTELPDPPYASRMDTGDLDK